MAPKKKYFYEILLDDEDKHFIKGSHWVVSNKYTKYVRVADKNGKYKYLHRLVMNEPKGLVIDHINGDGLDNRKSNLRICSQSQNIMNSKNRDRKLPRGVYKKKDKKRLLAQIKVNNKSINLGYFDCPLLAHVAYLDARNKYYGEFKEVRQ